MNLLTVIETLNPAAGGPTESVFQLRKALEKQGHRLDVISLDAEDDAVAQNANFPVIFLGPSLYSYRYNRRLAPYVRSIAHQYDGVVLHGMWCYPMYGAYLGLRKTGIPYIVLAHGNLDPYFIHDFPWKHLLKKQPYYRLIAEKVFREAHALVFTCPEERRLAAESYKPVTGNRKVVRFGINPPDLPNRFPSSSYSRLIDSRHHLGKKLLLYLGRIHPKKGCDLILEALKRTERDLPNIELLIAGPGDQWELQLQRRAEQLGISKRIHWLGPVYGRSKWELYRYADAFILPSHQESFGIAVVEALSQRLPVLISNRVNIHSVVSSYGAGLVEPDTMEGTESLLRRWASLPRSDYQTMKLAAFDVFNKEFLAEHFASDIIDLFAEAKQTDTGKKAPLTLKAI